MNWIALTKNEQPGQIITDSYQHPILIFKHSTSCSISAIAEYRLERSWKTEEVEGLATYYLDLLQYRAISNAIAEVFEVPHQSPQVLIISDGKCIFATSHMGISFKGVKKIVESLSAV